MSICDSDWVCSSSYFYQYILVIQREIFAAFCIAPVDNQHNSRLSGTVLQM